MGVASHGTNQASTTINGSTPAALGGSRLSLQCEPIGPDTTTIRSLDWDRSRFDIEFGLRNGTTYNSFLVRGERTALIDTSHLKFEGSWLPLLQEQIDPKAIDHLIVSHTEPDHSGLIHFELWQRQARRMNISELKKPVNLNEE